MIGPLIARYDDVEEARRELLARRSLGDTPLPAPVVQKIREVFGKDLSPSEVVARIIADVRADAAAETRRSPEAIDGRQIESLVVSPGQIDAAAPTVSPGVVAGLEAAAQQTGPFPERARRN